MPVWLVTGGGGFLGRHLLEWLESSQPGGIEVVLLGRNPPPNRTASPFLRADLEDPSAVERAVAEASPDVVFHLAGRTPPAPADAFYRSNTMATVHLLDALRGRARPVRVVLAGSAAELGPVATANLPVDEDYACRPAESYGLSKWLATAAGLVASRPLEVMVGRIFNPIGPGLPASQAFGRFAAALARPGPDPLAVEVGPLDTRRDFVDVRDVARALIALAERGGAGRLYHVGRGESHRVGDGLDYLIRLSGRDVTIATGPRGAAGGGPSDSRADIGRIRAETGWTPRVSWEQSLDDLWREAEGRARPLAS